MYSLVSWRHNAVSEAWLLLQIQWQRRCTPLLLATVVSLKCLILHIFSLCLYKKFANYPTLVCQHKLNKLPCWFSQRMWCQGSYGSSVPLSQQKRATSFCKTFDELSLDYGVLSFSREYFRASFSCNTFATLSCLDLGSNCVNICLPNILCCRFSRAEVHHLHEPSVLP